MYFLLNMGIFQPAMLDYRSVINFIDVLYLFEGRPFINPFQTLVNFLQFRLMKKSWDFDGKKKLKLHFSKTS